MNCFRRLYFISQRQGVVQYLQFSACASVDRQRTDKDRESACVSSSTCLSVLSANVFMQKFLKMANVFFPVGHEVCFHRNE